MDSRSIVRTSRASLTFSILAVAAIIIAVGFYAIALAATFTDDTQAEFNAGTHSNTEWSTDHVKLTSGQTSGTFTSQVFDGGDNGTVSWDQIVWTETLFTTKFLIADDRADIYHSVNSGVSWTLTKDDYNGSAANGMDHMVIDGNNKIFIFDAKKVWKSTDFGASWTKVSDNFGGGNAIRAAVDSSNNLYIADGTEDIWQSTDVGATWSQKADNMNGSNGNVTGFTGFGTTLYVIDSGADVWKSTDSGTTWTLVKDDYNGSDANTSTDNLDADGSGNLIAARNKDIWRSTDSGATWTKVATNYGGDNVSVLTIDNSGIVYVADVGEKIWKSTDNGSTWSQIATDANTGGSTIDGFVITTISNDITFAARSGSANPPTGSFSGSLTDPAGASPAVSNNRYFQYQTTFSSNDGTVSPKLSNVTITYTFTPAGVDATAPAAVTNLSAGSPSGTSILLSWTAPGDDGSTGTATSYDVRYSASSINDSNWASASAATGEPTPQAAGSSESFRVSGLSSATGYYFALKTSDEVPNTSTLSNLASATTTAPDTTPPVISTVEASNVTSNSAVITWITNESADSQVEFGGDSNYGSQTTLDSNLVTSHQATISGISSGREYHYRVKSKDADNNLATSTDAIFTTIAAPATTGGSGTGQPVRDTAPPVLSKVAVSDISFATATITWFSEEAGTSQVEYGTTTSYGIQTEKGVVLRHEHSVMIGGLLPGTDYHYRVSSEDLQGNVGYSEDAIFTTKAPPTPPRPPANPPKISNVRVVAVRPTSAKIIWQTDTSATSQIIFGTKPGELDQITLEFANLSKDHSISISDLIPETTHYFSVVSRNAQGDEATSSEDTFQTPSIEIQTVVTINKPTALPPGSPGTQVPKTAAGEMVTVVPILATEGDKTPPEVALFQFSENPTEDTSPLIRGRAIDGRGVIAGVSYSTDKGATWHPVTDIVGIGSSAARFSAEIPNLQDGNYPVLFRARDNSGNVGVSPSRELIIDIHPPATGANTWLLGMQAILPSARGALATLSGISQRIVTSAVGGATSVEVHAMMQNTEATGTPQIIIPLQYSKPDDLWFGDINFDDPGVYRLELLAADGGGRVSVREINPIVVEKAGLVKDAKTGTPVRDASVSVYYFSAAQNNFVLWPGEVFNQANPQMTDSEGQYRFVLPRGKYYLRVEHPNYRDFYTNIMEFKNHTIMNLELPLLSHPGIPLPISVFGVTKLRLPSLPDFFGARRIPEPPPSENKSLEAIEKMIGQPAPLFKLPNSAGKTIDLRYLRGKKTIITTWATWSPLAQIQIPILDKIQRENEGDTRIVLLSMQESAGLVEAYLRRGGYVLESIVDRQGELTDSYPILTLPQHFFIDRKGVVQNIHVGLLNADEVMEKLDELSQQIVTSDVTGGGIGGSDGIIKTAPLQVVVKDISSGYLNVRSGPGLQFEKTGQVQSGEAHDLIKEESGWYEIKASDTLTGWVSAEYTDKK